ncbi:unnamed protein product [Clavelina lepadiformis]|uniref:PQ-loop repeat-containing protein 2 n=1 Tax=Clavelina lepadiformis TaxID=159417 RepID=A0ABP0G5P2_CLALP
MYPIKPLSAVFEANYIATFGNESGNNNLSCLKENPIPWVYDIFDECIYNAKEEIGFILGLISILCWICASIPQLYENYKNGKCEEALSLWFLLLWLFGDSSNLVGCILTNQFPIQLYTAVYYVSMDLIMIVQFSYYAWKHRRIAEDRHGIINDAMTSAQGSQRILCCVCLMVFLPLTMMHFERNSVDSYSSSNRIGRTLLSVGKDPPFIEWTTKTIIGYAIGCISSLFYLGSRLPQILKNYRRGETEGVSFMMFFLAVAGNTLYGTSILLQDPDPGHTWGEFIVFHLPWLIGSIGTLSLDFAILSQIFYYNKRCGRKRMVNVGLLDESSSFEEENQPTFA